MLVHKNITQHLEHLPNHITTIEKSPTKFVNFWRFLCWTCTESAVSRVNDPRGYLFEALPVVAGGRDLQQRQHVAVVQEHVRNRGEKKFRQVVLDR